MRFLKLKKMENIDFVYLDGLHRPYNMPLKSIVWVCRFVKYMEDYSISILPSHFYGEFFRSLIPQHYYKIFFLST